MPFQRTSGSYSARDSPIGRLRTAGWKCLVRRKPSPNLACGRRAASGRDGVSDHIRSDNAALRTVAAANQHDPATQCLGLSPPGARGVAAPRGWQTSGCIWRPNGPHGYAEAKRRFCLRYFTSRSVGCSHSPYGTAVPSPFMETRSGDAQSGLPESAPTAEQHNVFSPGRHLPAHTPYRRS